MNRCIITGRLVRNAVTRGNGNKALVFTVASKYGYNEKENKDRVAYVPCVLFNPAPEIEEQLVQQGPRTYVELEGRVASSSYESGGEKKSSTEVIVYNQSVVIHPLTD